MLRSWAERRVCRTGRAAWVKMGHSQFSDGTESARDVTYLARVQLVETVDIVEIAKELRRNGGAEPEDGSLAVLDQVGPVRFHARIAGPHQAR